MGGRGRGLIAGAELRRRWAGYLGVALVLGVGGGAALAALIAAERTDRAFPEYIERAEVTRVVVNPSIASVEMDRVMRELPGVREVYTDALLLASVKYTEPILYSEGALDPDESSLQIRGSPDGRYNAVDRPIVTEGRFASGTHEVFVTEEFRSKLDRLVGHPVAVGDEIDMGFWWSFLEDAELDPDEVVRPIGVEKLTVVGFGRLADEVLPDELYPRERMIVSADVAKRYDCLSTIRPDMTADEAVRSAFPATCSRSYRYYSLVLDEGASVDRIREAFNEAGRELDKQLPAALGENVGYYFIAQDRADLDHAVRQATRPTVVSLLAFGIMAGIASLTVAALGVARLVERGRQDRFILRAIGAAPGWTARATMAPPVLAGGVGILLAVLIAFLASPIGPIGSVRDTEPSPGPSLPGVVTVPAILVAVVLFGAAVLAIGLRAGAGRPGRAESSVRPSHVAGFLRRIGSPPATTVGVRAGLGDRPGSGNVPLLAGAVVALASIVAAVVFGANLTGVVDDPDRFGWPWDATVITGGGYGETIVGVASATLDGDPDVADYSFYTLDGSSRLGDRIVQSVIGFKGSTPSKLPLVRGRQIEGPGEALVGSLTARDLDLDVGDRVGLDSTLLEVGDVEVVGIAVMPSLGPFVADRTGLGVGVFTVVAADADYEFSPATLTAIDLEDGADPKAFLRELRPELLSWSSQASVPYAYADAVRPPEIVNAESLRSGPLLLGGLLGVALVAGLGLSVTQSVRERRRELATLRSLGFRARDIRRTVHWQAVTVVGVGIVLGVPLGAVAGRVAWRAFADSVGLVPDADLSLGWLALIAAGAVVVVRLAAAAPARTAARITPADALLER